MGRLTVTSGGFAANALTIRDLEWLGVERLHQQRSISQFRSASEAP